MFFKIKAGTTGRSIPIRVQDSTSTTGALLSGLTASTSGLTCKYRRQGQATEQSVALTASGVTLDTFTSGGFIADPILAGHYELQIPNAALQAGATYVVITLSGAANMVPLGILIELDAVDYQVDAFGALKPTASGRTLDVTANGNAGIDLANVDNPTATLALTNTTISVGQQVASVSGNVVGSVGSVSGNVGGNVVGSVGSVAGNVSGNVNGSVGSVVGNVGGNVVGSVGAVAANVTVGGYAAGQEPPAATTIRDAVMNADPNAAWTDGSFGDRWLISNNNNRAVAVSGAGNGHIAATVHACEADSIPETAFVSGAISARVTSADFVTEIATGVAGIQVLVRLATMIESDGATGWEFTSGALVNTPSGGASDWTTNEKAAIRSILGFDASGAIVSLSSGALFAISTQTQNLFKYGDTQVWTSPANQINVTVTKA